MGRGGGRVNVANCTCIIMYIVCTFSFEEWLKYSSTHEKQKQNFLKTTENDVQM